MASFQHYAGVFEDDRDLFQWSCYATSRVYELRTFDDRLPAPPRGRKWVRKAEHPDGRRPLALLVDAPVTEVSHILGQVAPATERGLQTAATEAQQPWARTLVA